MRRIILLTSFVLIVTALQAQEHISFNGASFGKNKSDFEASFIGAPKSNQLLEHTYKNMYDRYWYPSIRIGNYSGYLYLHCSTKAKIVFETVAWFKVSNLKAELAQFVKVFEEKYGGHVNESQDTLGEIVDRNYDHSHYYKVYKEMLAFKYTISRKSDNKPIGEIRISAAPGHQPTYEGDWGYIEITYRDYAAAQASIEEYNSRMDQIF